MVELSTLVYSIMSAVGLAVCYWGQGNLHHLFDLPKTQDMQLKFLAMSLLAIGILMALSYLLEQWFASYRMLRQSLLAVLGGVSIPVAVYLAILSAIGEELLFRGAIQPTAGILFTSVLFAAMHLGTGFRISSWTIWAFLAGLLLGAIVESTQNLVPAILIHFAINCVSILWLRRDWQRLSDDERKILKTISSEIETSEP